MKDIIIKKSEIATGEYVVIIENYNTPTSWEDYKVYSTIFKTEAEADKSIVKKIKRYLKQGYVVRNSGQNHLKDYTFLVDPNEQ